MFKKRLLISALLVLCLANTAAFAEKVTTLQELQDSKTQDLKSIDPAKTFDNKHWAYKTLANISKKYGLLIGKPGEKFDGNAPLTRNEAAVILVNLTGKIEEDKLVISDAEKAQLDILRQELGEEVQKLLGRVATLETSVDTLKGSVTNLEEADKKDWKFDFGEKFKINGVIRGQYTGNIDKDESHAASNFGLPVVDLTFSGKLHPHISYKATMFPSRNFGSSANGILGDAYLATDIVPHHDIYLGQTRVPIGQEGSQSTYTLDTINRAQISRYYADYRDMGIKAQGHWNFVDYYAGIYNGTGDNINDIDGHLNYASWVVAKPLYKHPEYGKLEVGGGYDYGILELDRDDYYDSGKTTVANHRYGFYTGYNYKKFAIKGEYAAGNFYLNNNTYSDHRNNNGWYINTSYFLTKKLQLVARYDTFDTNLHEYDNNVREYTLGSNYYLHDPNIKLQFNLVDVDRESGKNGFRIMSLAQCMF